MKTFIHKMKSRKWNSFAVAACRLQSLYVFFFTLAVLGTVCIANTPVRADSLYDVNGTMTINGNNVCTPSPCSETVNFSLVFGYTFNSDYQMYQGYVVSANSSSVGVLGSSFAMLPAFIGNPNNVGNPISNSGCAGSDVNYIEFFDSPGDEIDLHACADLEPTPVAPTFGWTDLYSCATVTCLNDFRAPGVGNPLFLGGTLQTSVTAVPEGGASLGYLVISLAPIGLAIGLSKRKSRLCRSE